MGRDIRETLVNNGNFGSRNSTPKHKIMQRRDPIDYGLGLGLASMMLQRYKGC